LEYKKQDSQIQQEFSQITAKINNGLYNNSGKQGTIENIKSAGSFISSFLGFNPMEEVSDNDK